MISSSCFSNLIYFILVFHLFLFSVYLRKNSDLNKFESHG
ncbi:unnamed protein product [Brassica rapa subsp. trilocularis]